MKKTITCLLLISIAVTFGPLNAFSGQSDANTANLTIHIKGFENSNGFAAVALVNSEENYEGTEPFKGFFFKISNNEVIETIRNLPFGEYAVKVYHDENSNREMDTRIFGIPAERYGFSNNAPSTFGPPDYRDAVFHLDTDQKQITIIVH